MNAIRALRKYYDWIHEFQIRRPTIFRASGELFNSLPREQYLLDVYSMMLIGVEKLSLLRQMKIWFNKERGIIPYISGVATYKNKTEYGSILTLNTKDVYDDVIGEVFEGVKLEKYYKVPNPIKCIFNEVVYFPELAQLTESSDAVYDDILALENIFCPDGYAPKDFLSLLYDDSWIEVKKREVMGKHNKN